MSDWPGLFITFEGGDGAGKSTLMERVASTLLEQARPCMRTREPGGTDLGEQIRTLLLHSKQAITPRAELCLFLAARAQHIHDVILPALHEGKIVLCDRYNDSTIAYQGAGRGLGLDWTQQLCENVCDHVEPQVTFYLDVDPKVGMERVKRTSPKASLDRIEQERLAFHNVVREGFLALASRHSKRIHVIDASQSPDEVFAQVISHI